jgi:metal-sulfur cluster biosynthetic enzyme
VLGTSDAGESVSRATDVGTGAFDVGVGDGANAEKMIVGSVGAAVGCTVVGSCVVEVAVRVDGDEAVVERVGTEIECAVVERSWVEEVTVGVEFGSKMLVYRVLKPSWSTHSAADSGAKYAITLYVLPILKVSASNRRTTSSTPLPVLYVC